MTILQDQLFTRNVQTKTFIEAYPGFCGKDTDVIGQFFSANSSNR